VDRITVCGETIGDTPWHGKVIAFLSGATEVAVQRLTRTDSLAYGFARRM
jgi:hypothetical protein